MNNKYYNKYLKYKKKYFELKGGVVFNVKPTNKNCNPDATLNCGALVLHTFDIFNLININEISNRCQNKEFCPTTGGMSFSLLIKLIKSSPRYEEQIKDIKFIRRSILFKDFNWYWHNYAKDLLKKDGTNGIIILFTKNIKTYFGHFVCLVNMQDIPTIIDLQTKDEPLILEINSYFRDFFKDINVNNIKLQILENNAATTFVNDITNVRNISLINDEDEESDTEESGNNYEEPGSPRFWKNIKDDQLITEEEERIYIEQETKRKEEEVRRKEKEARRKEEEAIRKEEYKTNVEKYIFQRKEQLDKISSDYTLDIVPLEEYIFNRNYEDHDIITVGCIKTRKYKITLNINYLIDKDTNTYCIFNSDDIEILDFISKHKSIKNNNFVKYTIEQKPSILLDEEYKYNFDERLESSAFEFYKLINKKIYKLLLDNAQIKNEVSSIFCNDCQIYTTSDMFDIKCFKCKKSYCRLCSKISHSNTECTDKTDI
jgi:hypothetical protein